MASTSCARVCARGVSSWCGEAASGGAGHASVHGERRAGRGRTEQFSGRALPSQSAPPAWRRATTRGAATGDEGPHPNGVQGGGRGSLGGRAEDMGNGDGGRRTDGPAVTARIEAQPTAPHHLRAPLVKRLYPIQANSTPASLPCLPSLVAPTRGALAASGSRNSTPRGEARRGRAHHAVVCEAALAGGL